MCEIVHGPGTLGKNRLKVANCQLLATSGLMPAICSRTSGSVARAILSAANLSPTA